MKLRFTFCIHPQAITQQKHSLELSLTELADPLILTESAELLLCLKVITELLSPGMGARHIQIMFIMTGMDKLMFFSAQIHLRLIVPGRRYLSLIIGFTVFSMMAIPSGLAQQPTYLNGFPISFDDHFKAFFHGATPVIADFDRKGGKEVLFALHKVNNTRIYLVSSDGSIAENWPVNIYNTRVPPALAAGDINNDGFLDVVARAESLYVFNHQGQSLSGFPVNINHEQLPFVALYDLDEDGSAEIVTIGNNLVYVFRSNGTVMNGWPARLPGVWNEVFAPPPAIGNIDSDAEAEVVIVSSYCYGLGECDSSFIHVFNHDGSYVSGWPVRLDSGYTFYSQSPTILTGFSNSKILVNSSHFFPPNFDSTRTKTIVYSSNGTKISDFHTISFGECSSIPVSITGTDTILAFGSEPLTLFIANRAYNILHTLTGNGYYYNSPVSAEIYSTPYFLSYLRTIDLSLRCSLYFYDEKGLQASWSPLRPTGIPAAAPSFSDLNSDKQIDLVLLTNMTTNNTPVATLHVWTFPGSAYNSGIAYWSMYAHDRYRTNQYGFIPPDEPVGIQPISNVVPDEFELHQNFPNPFNPSTTIRFDINTSGNVTLKVYDVLGREVAVLADEYLRAGSYERMFEAAGLSSGVYFYTLRVTSGQTLRVTSGQALRVTSGQALRVTSGQALRVTSGQALRVTSGQALRVTSGQALRVTSGQALRVTSGQALRVTSGQPFE